MSKLSNYIFNINNRLNRGLISKNIVIDPYDLTYNIGNLVIREYYTRNKKGYTYGRETMIISNIIRNEYIGLQLQTVVSINGNTALVDPNLQTLFLYNNKWVNTLDDVDQNGNIIDDPTGLPDLNGDNIRCEKLSLINVDQVVKRTYISQNKFYEKDGLINNDPAPEMDTPDWC